MTSQLLSRNSCLLSTLTALVIGKVVSDGNVEIKILLNHGPISALELLVKQLLNVKHFALQPMIGTVIHYLKATVLALLTLLRKVLCFWRKERKGYVNPGSASAGLRAAVRTRLAWPLYLAS